MKFKILFLFIFLSKFGLAQIKTNLHTVSINTCMLDYFGPQTHKYFIHSGWDYPKQLNRTRLYWKPALQISYSYSLPQKITLKSSFLFTKLQMPTFLRDSNYIKSIIGHTASNSYYVRFDEKIKYTFLAKHSVKFYATSGFHIGYNLNNIFFEMPFGIGFEKNIFKQMALQFESNYAVGFVKNVHALTHSVGIAYSFSTLKKNKGIPVLTPQNFITEKDISKDSDKDGVGDKEDKCPDEKGDAYTWGCPDSDKDGVIDKEDKCPNEVGFSNNSGCPFVPEKSLQEIISELATQISFESSKAILTDSSIIVLQKITALLQKDSSWNIEIEGHTDNSGNENKNLILSQERADVCLQILVKNGIQENRIISIGYGSLKPIADNLTVEGRQKNRRVEIILEK